MLQTSAAGLLALLEEEDDLLKVHALTKLNDCVDDFWFQISAKTPLFEALYEDEDFEKRHLAALIAAKVFYHLGELDEALQYALAAGAAFDISLTTEFVQTLLARALDLYFELRKKQHEGDAEVVIDPRLTDIVERLFERCFDDGRHLHAIGIALEARRLDQLEVAVQRAADVDAAIRYALKVCLESIVNRAFRQQVLRLIVTLYEKVAAPDWVAICQCLMFLDDHVEVAAVLLKLLEGTEDDVLHAYQIAFDLHENDAQAFMTKLQAAVDAKAPPTPTPSDADTTPAPTDADVKPAPAPAAAVPEGGTEDAATPMESEGGAAAAPSAAGAEAAAVPAAGPAASTSADDPAQARLSSLRSILSGRKSTMLQLDFLYWHNKADLRILNSIKASFDQRISVCHSATLLANAAMHAGTTVDTFLRDNLEWLARATNWAKFSATAGLGIIHRGHLSQGRALLAPHLPRPDGPSVSPYSEGGALYSLGLIYANHGAEISGFLLSSLRNTQNEVVQHGACLGLGIAELGTLKEDAFEEVKNVLYTDSAVAGEAAGIAMGLLAAGTGSDATTEMLAYASDTQHEKIIRGLAVGVALIAYGREEEAETQIETMCSASDPYLRYGGMYTIGLAYRGTDNNAAIQRLLHFAVSDVSDDVRRAAVLNLGFLLMGVPHQCPNIVRLLAESFNPHVRYGAAMAVGIACASTGLPAATALLDGMLSDTVDFVRQGALIAGALVLCEQPETEVKPFRTKVMGFVSDKHEEVMCKMGAIMAAGILDAGGRNCTVGLRSLSGHFRRTAVVGLAVFTQYWYWFPLAYFLPLALQPTNLIGLDHTLAPPVMDIHIDCKASAFAYPEWVSATDGAAAPKAAAFTLSTTDKMRKRAAAKAQSAAGRKQFTGKPSWGKAKTSAAAPAGGETAQSAVGKPGGDGTAAGEATAMDTDGAPGTEDAAPTASKKEPEPKTHTAKNPARVVPGQRRYVRFDAASRFAPLKPRATCGILMMTDKKRGEAVEYVDHGAGGPAAVRADAAAGATPAAPAPEAEAAAPEAEAEEPPPPEPFEFTEDEGGQ